MKGMRGKLFKKLKAIKPIGYLKPDRILQINAAEGFFEAFVTGSNRKVEGTQMVCEETEQEKIKGRVESVQEQNVIDVSELMRDLEEEDEDEEEEEAGKVDDGIDDKENIGPAIEGESSVFCEGNVEVSRKSEPGFGRIRPLSEIDVSSFRRPDMNSGSLFDPNLLAAFEEAVNEHISISQKERNARIEQENFEKSRDEESKARIDPENHEQSRETEERNARICEEILEEEEEGEPPHKSRRINEEDDNVNPLLQFEERCPPGGEESVIFYTTTLRGIRKTFEDCSSVRFLLESFRVMFFERDVSMHMEFKEELWRLVDRKEAVPPRLFIKGRYIGGASEVLGLHEQGKLRLLFEGVPIDQSNGPCEGCAGVRFVLCYKCNGSNKVVDDDDDNGGFSSTKCRECNENGLIICPICC